MAIVNKTIKEHLLDILFPRFCLNCGKEGTYLCDDCKAVLDILECRYCLCDVNPKRTAKCNKCNHKKLSGLYFPLPKKPLTKKLIRYFKDEPYYLKDLAGTFAQLIIDHLSLLGEDIETLFRDSVLIPMPTNKKELKQRGYSPAEEIAKELSKLIDVSLVTEKEKVKGKKVFLINDVYATGSTMEEYSKELHSAGAKEVWGIVLTRN